MVILHTQNSQSKQQKRDDVYMNVNFDALYTYGTKKLWNFKIVADIQEWSKLKIYVDIYVI